MHVSQSHTEILHRFHASAFPASEHFASTLDGQQLVLAVGVVEHEVVPLLRQVRQWLQLDRLLGRGPPDPERYT